MMTSSGRRALKHGSCKAVKVLNLVWFIRAHMGEQAWGSHQAAVRCNMVELKAVKLEEFI
jgi:hypothetical protein